MRGPIQHPQIRREVSDTEYETKNTEEKHWLCEQIEEKKENTKFSEIYVCISKTVILNYVKHRGLKDEEFKPWW
jgi:hypothetical protein